MTLPFDWKVKTQLEGLPPKEKLNRQDAQQLAETLQRYLETARATMGTAQERMVAQANKHRRQPDFGIGDHVYIIKRSQLTDRPSDKLDFPLTRQHFKIKAMHGYSYELEVPANWTGTTVFPADRLRKFDNNPLPGQEAEEPDGEVLESGEKEWEVDDVLASRLHYGKLQYQVSWRGWDPDPNWYYAGLLKNSPALLKKYHDQYPEKAGPPKRLTEWMDAASSDRFDEDHVDDNRPIETTANPRLRRRRVRGDR
jgi:hypothetical protein